MLALPFSVKGIGYISFASEMTYIVSGGALNSTHSLSRIYFVGGTKLCCLVTEIRYRKPHTIETAVMLVQTFCSADKETQRLLRSERHRHFSLVPRQKIQSRFVATNSRFGEARQVTANHQRLGKKVKCVTLRDGLTSALRVRLHNK